MASLAEISVASVPVKDLAALQEHLLNHREHYSEAGAPQLVPEAGHDDLTNAHQDGSENASEDASAVIADSADAYGTPKSSSPHVHPARRFSSTKSAPSVQRETTVQHHPSRLQSQEMARTMMSRAESFHGFPGGDTQPMDSQVYRHYTESMALAKSSATITPKKTSPEEGKQDIYDTTTAATGTGRTPHTYIEGETGFIDLEAAWQHDSPTARSTTSGIDELLASPQTQVQVAELTQKRTMPETPAMAGHKRRSSGEIVSPATAETKKTPGFSQLFGAVPKAAVLSATQLFGQTQAPSSPLPDAPRSDPVITRPSPNMNERFAVSSPPVFRSSPMVTMHGRPNTFSGEPRDTYTSMQESDERRRAREEMEQRQWRRVGRVTEEEDFDLEGEEEGAQQQQQQLSRMRRIMSDQTLGEWSKMGAPARPGSRPGSSRKETAMIDLVTPATVRHGGEGLDFDDLGDSDEDVADEEEEEEEEEEGVQKPGVGDEDENDVYDELAQTVLRSQPDEVDDGDEEPGGHESDDESVAHENAAGDDVEMHDEEEEEEVRESRGYTRAAAFQAFPAPERAVTATQRSAVADSQPLHQEKHRSLPTMSQIPPSSKTSFVPGSQYAGKTSVELTTLRSSQSGRPAENVALSGEPLEKIPSSPPLPVVCSTLPEGSAEASLARRHILAQFQKPPAIERRNIMVEMEIPESDALVADEARPGTARSILPERASRVRESNGLPAPFSTAQTHLSAFGPSQAKERLLGVDKSPLKASASQRSGLSADSPRKMAGVRRFADIAADPSPPEDLMEDADVDVDAIMSDVMTAEDRAFIDAMSSPVSKPSKRRKLTRDVSNIAHFGNVSMAKGAEKPAVVESPAQTKRLLPTISEVAAEELGAELAPSVLRSSPSKGNELPVSTPHIADTPKSTQESVKKREQAGAAAVSQLLAARSVKPTRLAKLAGRGRKAGVLAETEPITKAAPKHLDVKTSNSRVKRVERESERGRAVLREDEVLNAQQLVVDSAANTPAEPVQQTAQEPAADEADDSGLPITAPHRIFALFKGTFNNFYPATWLSTSSDGKSYRVRFDDTTDTVIDAGHVRALDLRVGDHVKVDGKDMRNKVWTIKEFAASAQTEEDRAMGTDVQGHHVVRVQVRSSRNSLPANNQVMQGEGEMVEVLISSIYITHSLWPAFADRTFTPPDTARVNNEGRLATPSTGLQTPDAETPGSRSRRKLLPSVKTAARRISHLREESVASGGSTRAGTEMFAGMAFAISYGSNEAERADVTGSILAHGGIILESGFDELFDQPSLDDALPPSPRKQQLGGSEHAGLVLKPKYSDLGFVALIADRHSRRAKYMQALALGLPTLSGRWIADSLGARADQTRTGAPLPWSKYLLAAGESSYLNGGIRSRTMAITSSSAAESRLVDAIAERAKLLEGDGVLIVASTKHKATWERRKTYAFLTLALGAGRVRRVGDLAEAKRLLAAGGGEEEEEDGRGGWKWVYVDGCVGEASAVLFGSGTVAVASGKKRKRGGEGTPKLVDAKTMTAASRHGRVRVVNDEFVVQSLILGALVD
ncbi:hypothetical protein B0A55_06060 [Friedmanniomyces simplex]|uniref:BRCT domain-containing protein n=1 Tax=Friedmanniomyces simplex TaxID=329884 RepID=A0A4U0XBT5_9PEZI|nr:hypothetical protein B0A55_06060 [Friedmanniomyces simplex]